MTESSFGSLKSSSPSNARCLQILTKSNFEILPDRESPLMIRLRGREKQQPKSASNPQPPGLRPQLVGAEFAPPRPCAKFQLAIKPAQRLDNSQPVGLSRIDRNRIAACQRSLQPSVTALLFLLESRQRSPCTAFPWRRQLTIAGRVNNVWWASSPGFCNI